MNIFRSIVSMNSPMIIGLLAIMTATALPLLKLDEYSVFGFTLWRYLYAAGAVLLLVLRIVNGYKGTDLRLKRLHRLEFWSAVIFCTGTFFIFYQPHTTDWLAFTMAGAFIQAYASIMISRHSNKAA